MGQVDIVHVPYKGGGPAMADLMAGLVDIYFGGLSTALPHVKAGKLRALGQTSTARSAAAPDIPTIAEVGPAGLRGGDLLRHLPAGRRVAGPGRHACTPPSTPPSARPRSRRSSPSSAPIRSSARPPQFAAYVADDFAKWARLAKEAGLKVE